MLLYHFSNLRFDRLTPKYGERRHSGEDSTSVNKEGIFLTTDTIMIQKEDDGKNFYKYRYSVEIDKNDPNLLHEEGFNNLMKQFSKEFYTQSIQWYFYTAKLDYVSMAKWDSKIKNFVVQ